MSKSLLVKDTPKSCSKCDFVSVYGYQKFSCTASCEGKLHIPKIHANLIEYKNKIHPQCPLQDTTELLDDLNVLQTNAVEGLEESQMTMDSQRIITKLRKALGGKQ